MSFLVRPATNALRAQTFDSCTVPRSAANADGEGIDIVGRHMHPDQTLRDESAHGVELLRSSERPVDVGRHVNSHGPRGKRDPQGLQGIAHRAPRVERTGDGHRFPALRSRRVTSRVSGEGQPAPVALVAPSPSSHRGTRPQDPAEPVRPSRNVRCDAPAGKGSGQPLEYRRSCFTSWPFNHRPGHSRDSAPLRSRIGRYRSTVPEVSVIFSMRRTAPMRSAIIRSPIAVPGTEWAMWNAPA